MKYIFALLLVVLMSACGEKNSTSSTSTVERVVSQNVNGTYSASDKTKFSFKDGVITMEPHGVFPARTAKYTIQNNRIEYTFDTPGYFIIKDDKTLMWRGQLEYVKK